MSNSQGVTLQSYATVMAGLGAGLPLRRALEVASVSETAWDPAAEHWQEELNESAASDLALLVAFDNTLLVEQRRFEPTIEPITSDVGAWACFRRHFVTAPQPVTFLAQRDLSLAAYARLEADWANRSATDEALAAALQRHMAGPLGPCPELTRTPSPLLSERGAPDAQPPSTLDVPAPITQDAPGAADDSSESALGPWSASRSTALPFSIHADASGEPAAFWRQDAGQIGDDDEQTIPSLGAPLGPPLPFVTKTALVYSSSGPDIQNTADADDEERLTALPAARAEPTLPFRVGTGTMASAPSPTQVLRPRLPSDVEQTLLPSQAKLLAPTLPFARPATEQGPASGPPPPIPAGLPIERFAVIHAELESGAPADEVLAKHRLNALSWAGINEAWRRRLEAIPEEADRAVTLIEAVRARLAKK